MAGLGIAEWETCKGASVEAVAAKYWTTSDGLRLWLQRCYPEYGGAQ